MLYLHLLGTLQITSSPAGYGGLSSGAQALLVYLALNQGEHARAELAQLLWTQEPSAVAHHQLEQVLHELQQQVGHYVQITPQGVTFRTDAPHKIDLLEFQQKTQSAAPGEMWPDTEALTEAVALYTGDLWASFPVDELSHAAAFTAWLQDERKRWRRRMLLSLETLADDSIADNQYEAAIGHMERLLQLEPTHEGAHRRIMLARARLDQLERALGQYDACVQALAAVGRTPSPPTRALLTRIELASTDAQRELPGESTAFVGRDPEQTQLQNMLLNREIKLITLTGLGGIGKTRLAIEAARQLVADPHRLFLSGVVFVPLAGVSSPDDVPLALINALGLTPTAKAEPTEHLLNHLRPRELLLLLDNVEHLLDGDTLIRQILDECPEVTLLVTSRVPLLLDEEWRFDVTGLTCTPPAPSASTPCASTQLFVQAAQRALPSFQLDDSNRMDVYRLCDLVSGIPLAIELAAAWSNTLTTSEIVEHVQSNLDMLTDQFQTMPSRQRSMRVVLDYTWAQLHAEDRYMLQALSLCRAPFTEAAAQRIAEQDPARLPILAEHNLLQMEFAVDGVRYEMHELIRQYGEERLAHAAETGGDLSAEQVHQRHACFYLELLAEHEDALFGDAPHQAIARLRQEIDNLRVAWQWAVEQMEQPRMQQHLAQSAEAMAIFYENTGWVQEGERCFDAALAAWDALTAPEEEPGEPDESWLDDPLLCDLLCQLLIKSARFAELKGNNQRVETLVKRARSLAQRTGNALRDADALRIWGRTLGEMGELAESIYFLESSVQLYRSLERTRELAITLNALGSVYLHDQQLEAALRCTEEALQLHTTAGNRRGGAFSISQLGNIHYYQENFREALAHLQQALDQFEGVNYSLGITRTANNVGYVHWRLGEPDAALPYLERSLKMARQMGIRREEGNTLESLGSVYRALGQYERAARSFQRSLEQAQDVHWQLGIVWGNVGLGLLHQETGELALAQTHLQRALEQAQLLENEREIAICLGHLGALQAHAEPAAQQTPATQQTPTTQQIEMALQQLDSAIELLLELSSPYEASHFLVERASLLLQCEQLVEAEGAVEQALQTAYAAEHHAAYHQATLLRARLRAAQGDQPHALRQLHTALAAAENKTEQADVHHLIWRTNGSLYHAQQAHELYAELYAQTPLRAYEATLKELDSVVGGVSAAEEK